MHGENKFPKGVLAKMEVNSLLSCFFIRRHIIFDVTYDKGRRRINWTELEFFLHVAVLYVSMWGIHTFKKITFPAGYPAEQLLITAACNKVGSSMKKKKLGIAYNGQTSDYSFQQIDHILALNWKLNITLLIVLIGRQANFDGIENNLFKKRNYLCMLFGLQTTTACLKKSI